MSVNNLPEGSYLSKKGYVIRKDSISNDELQYLRKELRGRPLQDEKYAFFNQKDTSFPIYTETKNKIYIPKMFGIERYGRPKKSMPSFIGKTWGRDIAFKGSLYPVQVCASNKLIEELHTKGGGIISLATGLGKTITALHTISNLKGKTIVVVNKIPLMKQWESEIRTFLPDVEIGFIQGQKNISVEGKDIVLAMLQSLARVEYPDSLFEEFNTVVIDECHNTSSKVFSQVLSKLSCQYTIGLSATPKRSDGCEYIFKYHIGKIVYQSSTKRDGLSPILNVIKIDSSEYKEICITNKMTGQTQIQFTSMLSELVEMQKRNKLIIEMIKELVNKEGRKILVLSDRRTHLQTLKRLLDSDLGITFTYGLFLGQMKIKDLEKSKASQVILASYQAFGEGVSEKDLDTLFLITPKKFIGHLKNSTKNESGKMEQIVGRIFRKEHLDKNPLIIDLFDNFSIYKNQSAQRKIFYKQHFPTLLTKEQTINLDDIELNNISLSHLITKKDNSQNTQNIDETINMINHCIIDHCIIDDDDDDENA
jgi:superfamily II DNA or RNA helicase